MRYSLLGLALLSSLAIAEPAKDTLSQDRFEERFHAADKNKEVAQKSIRDIAFINLSKCS